MVKCEICGDRVEIYTCQHCEIAFCEKCGDGAESICEYCLEEEL